MAEILETQEQFPVQAGIQVLNGPFALSLSKGG
jgi:hypothetical protein